MLYFESKSNDPYYNLALEDYLFHKIDENEDLFMLWQNDNAIIIGKYQNTMEEINLDYVNENGITVARRMTGGGAVYHDLGNVNFTFVNGNSEKMAFQFSDFIMPLVNVLEGMGIKAEFTGRNDVTIDGKKISGNSQHIEKKKLLHHGCILLEGNLGVVSNALKVDPEKFKSKSIKSVRSRVTNINAETDNPLTVREFMDALKSEVGKTVELKEVVLTDEDLNNIQNLRDEKYATWDWNFGESPSYDFQTKQRFDCGTVMIQMKVNRGAEISSFRIFGDFFGVDDIHELEEKLTGISLTEVKAVLEETEVGRYINGMTSQELLGMINVSMGDN